MTHIAIQLSSYTLDFSCIGLGIYTRTIYLYVWISQCNGICNSQFPLMFPGQRIKSEGCRSSLKLQTLAKSFTQNAIRWQGLLSHFFFFGHSASTWKVHKKSFEIDSDMGNVFTPNELADGGRSFKLYFGEMKISCRLKLSKCQRQDMHSAQRNQDEFRTIFGGRCKAKCYKCLLSNWRWRGGGGKAERWARKIGWKSGRASDDRLSCLHKLSAQGCAHKL